MPGLYGRVQARGFPAPAVAGYDAAAVSAAELANQGGTADPAHGVRYYGTAPSTLHGFSLEGAAPPGDYGYLPDVDGPGELRDPNQTPGYGPGSFRSHAAAPHGWAGSYHDLEAVAALHENASERHGVNFGNPLLQDFGPGQSPGGDLIPMDPSGAEDYGASAQAPLEGAARVLGGRDAVQGYGGGGSGPGGVNGNGYGSVRATRLGVTGNVINAYLDPAERPFMVPQAAGSFIPTDAITGPGEPYQYLGGDGIVRHAPTAYQAPAQPATLDGTLTAAESWGW